MAGILTLTPKESLATLRQHWRFALARLKSDATATAHVAPFTQFETELIAAETAERSADETIIDAHAGCAAADAKLDAVVDRVASAALLVKRRSPDSKLQQLYFGSETPSRFRRPVLGTELEKCQPWPALLSAAADPELKAIAADAQAAVQGGNVAAKALADALQARDVFRLSGARKKVFDDWNALASATYGERKAFVHQNPALGLGTKYAESFFLGARASSQGASLSDAERSLERAKAGAAKAQTKHDAEVKKQADRAAAAAEHAKNVATAKAARAEVAAARKKASEAKAAAKKKPKK